MKALNVDHLLMLDPPFKDMVAKPRSSRSYGSDPHRVYANLDRWMGCSLHLEGGWLGAWPLGVLATHLPTYWYLIPSCEAFGTFLIIRTLSIHSTHKMLPTLRMDPHFDRREKGKPNVGQKDNAT